MAFMASELAINPDIQKKLRDEIDKTNEECNGQLTYDAIMNMKYMDMVLSGIIIILLVWHLPQNFYLMRPLLMC